MIYNENIRQCWNTMRKSSNKTNYNTFIFRFIIKVEIFFNTIYSSMIDVITFKFKSILNVII